MKGGTPPGSLDKWEGIAMVEAVQRRSNKISRDSRLSTRNYVHAGKNGRKQDGSRTIMNHLSQRRLKARARVSNRIRVLVIIASSLIDSLHASGPVHPNRSGPGARRSLAPVELRAPSISRAQRRHKHCEGDDSPGSHLVRVTDHHSNSGKHYLSRSPLLILARDSRDLASRNTTQAYAEIR